MKRVLFLFIGAFSLLIACSEQPGATANKAADLQLDTAAPIDSTGHKEPEDVYYGIDSEDDTVVYEKDGVILSSGVISGTFHHMDRHDFMHFVLADSNGMLHSFFMNTKNQRQMDVYYEGYEPARGHPVTVKWERGALSLGQDGSKKTVYQAVEIIE